jgi:hypothetical protein
MVRVKLYSKEGCWLCDMALDMLNGQMEKYGILLERIDIGSDGELFDLYRYDVPVLEFADGTTLNGHIKKKALLGKLESTRE